MQSRRLLINAVSGSQRPPDGDPVLHPSLQALLLLHKFIISSVDRCDHGCLVWEWGKQTFSTKPRRALFGKMYELNPSKCEENLKDVQFGKQT